MNKILLRKICTAAILSGIAALLMLLEFPLPMLPSFIKLDFSDLPAVLTGFICGPFWGVLVSLLKNLLHLPMTSSFGVGEMCNFFISVGYVLPASLIFRTRPCKHMAVIGCLAGIIAASAVSFPLNYYVTYPIYCRLFGGMETVLNAYRAINPAMTDLAQCLAWFNIPFTLVKGSAVSVMCFLCYRPLKGVIMRFLHKS